MSSNKDKIAELEAEIKRLNKLIEQLKAEAKAKEFMERELEDTILHLLQKLAEYEQETEDTSDLN